MVDKNLSDAVATAIHRLERYDYSVEDGLAYVNTSDLREELNRIDNAELSLNPCHLNGLETYHTAGVSSGLLVLLNHKATSFEHVVQTVSFETQE